MEGGGGGGGRNGRGWGGRWGGVGGGGSLASYWPAGCRVLWFCQESCDVAASGRTTDVYLMSVGSTSFFGASRRLC